MADHQFSLFSPAIALCLDPEAVRELLKAHGGGDLLPRAKITQVDLVRALWGRFVKTRVATLLARLARLSTVVARDALIEAAKDLRMPCDGWEGESPAELATRLLTVAAGRKTGPWEALFERADTRIARFLPEVPSIERLGKEPRALRGTEKVAKEVRAALGDAFVDLWLSEEEDEMLHLAVLYLGPAETCLRREGSRTVREKVRPLRVAELSLVVSAARLSISTARQQHVPLYMRALGVALYGDPAFFGHDAAIDLQWLLALRDEKGEAKRVAGLAGSAKVIACQLVETDGRVEARGANPLVKISRNLEEGGRFGRGTIRFEVEGAPWAIDVVAEQPDKLTIGGAARPFTTAVRSALGTLGVYGAGAGSVTGDDITTLMGAMPEWSWQKAVGEEGVAVMKREKRLLSVEGRKTRRAAAPEYRRMGNAVAFALKNAADKGKYYLVGDDWAQPAVTVREADLAMWQLDMARLLEDMRRDLGLVKGEAPELPKGVLYVGDLSCRSGTARVFYVVRAVRGREDAAGIVKAVQAAVAAGSAVLMVPAGKKMETDVLQVELTLEEQLGRKIVRGRGRQMARALGVLGELDKQRQVDPDVTYVIDEKQERFWVDGVEITAMGDMGFKMVLFLAKRAGEVVPTKEVNTHLSRAGDGQAAKKTRLRVRRWVAAEFKKLGRTVPPEVADGGLEWIPNKGWRFSGRVAIV